MMRHLFVSLLLLCGATTPAWAQVTQTLGAANACAVMDVAGMGTGAIELTQTWAGTITFQVSVTGGTYNDLDVAKADTPSTFVNTTTANGLWSGAVAGYRFLRACMTTYTSGQARVYLSAAPGGGGGGGGGGSAGAEYTEGDTDATITGHAILWEDTGDTLTPVSASKPLPVSTDSNSITSLTELPAPATLANNLAVPSTTLIGAVCMVYDGATIDFCTNNDVVEDAGETAGGTGPMVLSVRRDTAASSAGTTGDNASFNTDGLGRLWTRRGDPCADHARILSVPIDTASSGNVELVALNSGDIVYVCGYTVVASAATAFQLIYGTGTACATGETDLTGPMAFAANGGAVEPVTGAAQYKSAVSNALCLENSGANQLSGSLKYVRTAAP